MKSRKVVTLLLVMVSVIPFVQIHNARATGTISVDPPVTTIMSVGSTFTVAVTVANIGLMNGWDIRLKSDSLVINPIGLSTTGNVLGSPTVLASCINGVGLGCDTVAGDGPGVIHSADVIIGTKQNVSGMIFSVTYNVTSSASTYSGINFKKAELSDGTVTPVTPTPNDGVYGTQGPDFVLSTSIQSFNITQGNSKTISIEVRSVNGFTDAVTLSATESLSGLNTTFSLDTVLPPPNRTDASALTISTTLSTLATRHVITVTGTNSTLSQRTVDVTVSIREPGDFLIAVNPSQLLIHASASGNSTVTVSSQQGFAGKVDLGVRTLTAGLVVTLENRTLTLTAGGTATTTLRVNTPQSSQVFRYTVTLSARHGSLIHSMEIYILPPQPDIGLTVSATTLTVKPGASASLYVNVTSNDYFRGIVYLLATSISGIKLSYSVSTVPLRFPRWELDRGNSTLLLTVDGSAPTGQHSLVLAALSGAVSRSVTVDIIVPLAANTTSQTTATALRTILGLQPSTYFGIIAALAIMLGVLALREVRRPKEGRRIFLEDDSPRSTAMTKEGL